MEDDEAQRDALASVLIARGYNVSEATTGESALQMAAIARPDLVLLDLGLPDVNGLALCRHLRIQLDCPVIVVTGDAAEDRMVDALDTGADDYVVKPFSTNELLARIRVALRHRVATAPLVEELLLRCGDVEVDVTAYQVAIAGTVIEMLPRQFDLLVALMRNEGRVMTYAMLTRLLWGLDIVGDHHAHSLRTSISRIRRTLGVGPRRPLINTERNIGYRLIAPLDPRLDHTA